MAKEKILIVEDDEDIMELISFNLEQERYLIRKADSGERALQEVSKELPALILLDLMLPEINGLDVCRRLKADTKTQSIPVLMVTAKGEESDIVTGLELGAVDYITKPFRPKELVARVRSALRVVSNSKEETLEILRVHEIEINPMKREVRVEGKSIELTFSEFQILYTLAKKAGWVFTRYQIVNAVRGEDYPVTDRSIDVQIVGLRKKLGRAGKYIETVRGVGYRLKE
ncbi:MAG: response regulator transcription factor [Opitutaceae bacterium]|nr:response regulator transcription factor [Opitutaceae bacterium]